MHSLARRGSSLGLALLAAATVVGCAERRAPEALRSSAAAWTPVGSMVRARDLFAMVRLADGRVLAQGGYTDQGNYTGSAEIFDPATNKWSDVASAAYTRHDQGIALLASGKVLVASGIETGFFPEVYDPAANTWSKLTVAQPGPQFNTSATLLGNGQVLIAGGGGYDDAGVWTATSAAEVYDPGSNTLTASGTLRAARDGHGVAVLPNGEVLIFGGQTYVPTRALSSTETYNTSSFTFRPNPSSMKGARWAFAYATLADGRILAAAGELDGAPLSTAEIYDPTADAGSGSGLGAWSATGALATARTDAAAVRLLDGRVLVAGGNGPTGLLSSVEIFDPRANAGLGAWSAGPSLAQARVHPRAVLLKDGSVLVAGGHAIGDGGSQVPLSSAERLSVAELGGDAGVDAADAAIGPPVDAAKGPPTLEGDAKSCKLDGECASGFCVDGVCCNARCDAKCSSCALPWSPGKCAPQPYGYDLRHDCGAANSCTQTCGTDGACAPVRSGDQCAPSRCVDPSHGVGPAYCPAVGAACATTAVTAFDCGAYSCEPAFGACHVACTSSDQCAPGFACDTAAGHCVVATSSTDSGGCAVGHAPGTVAVLAPFGLVLGLAAWRARRSRRARR